MKKIPATKDSLVLRTDFSDDSAWLAICAAIQAPVGEFQAYVQCVSDPDYANLEDAALVEALSGNRSFAFVVDHIALSHPEHPILVVDLSREVGRMFRVIPSHAWSVENNLSLANMDFGEFADAVDQSGIFRGFPDE